MPALGEEFRSAREARGLTLSDVAEQIHIRSVYLNAIENEEWPSIGAPVYVRGFIRTYARFLGLDAESAVGRFNDMAPVERPSAYAPVSSVVEAERTGPSPWAVLGGVIALLLVVFAGYEWWQFSQGARQAGQPVAVASAPAAVAQPAAAPVGSQTSAPAPRAPKPGPALRHRLAIQLSQRSWLRLTVDGKTQLEGIYPAGTAKSFSGKVADLRVGNAGGVHVSVNGAPAKTLGKDGDVIEQRYPL